MQKCSATGLMADSEHGRATFVPTFNATQGVADHVRGMWANKTPKGAHDILALKDVTVTNAKDKAHFLPKLLMMNDDVKAFYARNAAALSLSGAEV